MEDTIITFETAKLAKKKEFNEICQYYYEILDKPITLQKMSCSNVEGYKQPTAPTQSLLAKWLRDEYRIFININYDGNDEVFRVEIIKQNNDRSRKVFYLKEENIIMMFHSYEEALEIGLQEALKLI
jgi:hypothetical protein